MNGFILNIEKCNDYIFEIIFDNFKYIINYCNKYYAITDVFENYIEKHIHNDNIIVTNSKYTYVLNINNGSINKIKNGLLLFKMDEIIFKEKPKDAIDLIEIDNELHIVYQKYEPSEIYIDNNKILDGHYLCYNYESSTLVYEYNEELRSYDILGKSYGYYDHSYGPVIINFNKYDIYSQYNYKNLIMPIEYENTFGYACMSWDLSQVYWITNYKKDISYVDYSNLYDKYYFKINDNLYIGN